MFKQGIRFTLLNYLKLNTSAMVVIASTNNTMAEVIPHSLFLLALASLPFVYYFVLRKKQDELGEEVSRRKFESLYDGLRLREVQSEHEGVAQIKVQWPVVWFLLRRLVFVAVTVWLFEHPVLQMIAAQTLSLLMLANLAYSSVRYVERSRQVVEVMAESLLLVMQVIIMQFMAHMDSESAKQTNTDLFVGALSIQTAFCVAYMVYSFIKNKKAQVHAKKLD